jgi:hypothetical protein
MIPFILLFFFFILAVVLAGVAYSANNRKNSGITEIPSRNSRRNTGNRTSAQN